MLNERILPPVSTGHNFPALTQSIFIRRSLPAQPFVGLAGGGSPGLLQIHQVDDNVLRAKMRDRKSTRLNSSHLGISYAVFCLKKKKRDEIVSQVINEQDHRRPRIVHRD